MPPTSREKKNVEKGKAHFLTKRWRESIKSATPATAKKQQQAQLKRERRSPLHTCRCRPGLNGLSSVITSFCNVGIRCSCPSTCRNPWWWKTRHRRTWLKSTWPLLSTISHFYHIFTFFFDRKVIIRQCSETCEKSCGISIRMRQVTQKPLLCIVKCSMRIPVQQRLRESKRNSGHSPNWFNTDFAV